MGRDLEDPFQLMSTQKFSGRKLLPFENDWANIAVREYDKLISI